MIYLIDGMSMAVFSTMHLSRQMRMFWSNSGQTAREMCTNWTSLRANTIQTAISKIKSWKAPDIDGNKGKLIKGSGEALACIHVMHKISNKIWATGKFPMLWMKSLMFTIPKKGDTTKCLICHSSKMILEIIRSWMKNDIRIENGRGTSRIQTR